MALVRSTAVGERYLHQESGINAMQYNVLDQSDATSGLVARWFVSLEHIDRIIPISEADATNGLLLKIESIEAIHCEA
jgi:hypothetical protein